MAFFKRFRSASRKKSRMHRKFERVPKLVDPPHDKDEAATTPQGVHVQDMDLEEEKEVIQSTPQAFLQALGEDTADIKKDETVPQPSKGDLLDGIVKEITTTQKVPASVATPDNAQDDGASIGDLTEGSDIRAAASQQSPSTNQRLLPEGHASTALPTSLLEVSNSFSTVGTDGPALIAPPYALLKERTAQKSQENRARCSQLDVAILNHDAQHDFEYDENDLVVEAPILPVRSAWCACW